MTPTGFRVFNDINDLAKSLQVFLPIITHYNPQKLQTNFVQGVIVVGSATLSPRRGNLFSTAGHYCLLANGHIATAFICHGASHRY